MPSFAVVAAHLHALSADEIVTRAARVTDPDPGNAADWLDRYLLTRAALADAYRGGQVALADRRRYAFLALIAAELAPLRVRGQVLLADGFAHLGFNCRWPSYVECTWVEDLLGMAYHPAEIVRCGRPAPHADVADLLTLFRLREVGGKLMAELDETANRRIRNVAELTRELVATTDNRPGTAIFRRAGPGGAGGPHAQQREGPR